MKSYKVVSNTRGNARYYKTKTKRKTWKYERTLPKKLRGKSHYPHLYTRKR